MTTSEALWLLGAYGFGHVLVGGIVPYILYRRERRRREREEQRNPTIHWPERRR